LLPSFYNKYSSQVKICGSNIGVLWSSSVEKFTIPSPDFVELFLEIWKQCHIDVYKIPKLLFAKKISCAASQGASK
jgi:hypothetical protein